ncbi:MAG: ribosome maturation factor RimM [Candidatus Geothermincolia bacterium]
MIVGAHGVKGWLRVVSLSDNPDRFRVGRRFFIEDEDGLKPVIMDEVSPGPGFLRLHLGGVDSRPEALSLKGRQLLIPESEVEPLPEGEYWEHQLIGLRVLTVAGDKLGVVEDIIWAAGNDVYVVRGEREHLIPASKEVVVRIDLEEGVMVVDPLPGLLEL